MANQNEQRNIYNGAHEKTDGLRPVLVLKLTDEEKAQKRELARQANQRMENQKLQNVKSLKVFIDEQALHAHKEQHAEELKDKRFTQLYKVEQTHDQSSLQEVYVENATLVGIGFGEIAGDELTTFEQARREAIKHDMPTSYLEKVVDEQTGEVRNIAHIVYPHEKIKPV